MRIPWKACVTAWVIVAESAAAQLVTEVIELHEGWNAVWVNGAPDPSDWEQIVALQVPPLDYQAIWTFEPNPAIGGSGDPPGRWLFYDRDVPFELTTLRTLQGHRAYFIQMRSAGQLRLDGRPLVRSTQFTSRASNLFGALTDAASGPLSFERHFSHPNTAGKIRASGAPLRHDIFTLAGDVLTRRSITDPIEPNTAYWLNVVQDFSYMGPLDASANINGISFGKSTAQRTLVVQVPSSREDRTVTIQARPCAVLSAGGECVASAGQVQWLEYRDVGKAGLPVWRPLSEGVDLVASAGVTRIELELRARRVDLAASARLGNTAGADQTAPIVVDVTDQNGSRVALSADVAIEPIFGRWVGQATLTHVSAHPDVQEIPVEQAEAAPLTMTLLLELPDPSGGGGAPRLLDSLAVQGFRDGRPVTRRFHSILFDRPFELSEDKADALDPFGAAGTLRGTLHIRPDDPLNPYRHRYNPEHRTGYDITREITIKIEPRADSLADEIAGLDGTFGPHRLTGQYTEVITGVTELPITVRGTFTMERMSEDAALP